MKRYLTVASLSIVAFIGLTLFAPEATAQSRWHTEPEVSVTIGTSHCSRHTCVQGAIRLGDRPGYHRHGVILSPYPVVRHRDPVIVYEPVYVEPRPALRPIMALDPECACYRKVLIPND